MEDRQIIGGRWRFCDVIGQKPLEVDYRVLTKYAWVGKVEFQVECTPPKGKVTSKTYPADERHSDPWVYAVHFQPDAATTVVVKILVDGDVQLSESVDISEPLNAPHDKKFSPQASRLVRAVNTTPIGCPGYTDDQDDANATIDDKRVKIILDWIWHRLSGGLDRAWLGPDAGRGLSLDELKLSAAARQSEEWARGFAELVVGTRYNGAETGWYFFRFNGPKDETDGHHTKRMAARRDAEKGRSWFPLGFACQQMATFGLMIGNYPYSDFQPALNAGGSLSLPVFSTQKGGHYRPTDKAGSPPKSVRTPRGGLAAAPPVCPGTVYEFYDTPNGKGAHIGMLIRVHPDQDGWCGIQSIDTGGLNAPLRKTPKNFNDRNYDDPWLLNDDPVHGVKPFKGVGVPYANPPLSLATIRTWWPLGFARLILRRRSDKKLLYATPMLRMHFGTQGFPLALYGWSLRCRPFSAAVEARWQITIPQRDFARTAVDSGPNFTMTQLLQARGIPTNQPDKPLDAKGPEGPRLYFFASIHVDKTSDYATRDTSGAAVADGQNMPWGVRSRDSTAPPFPPLTDVPEYFRGDEKPKPPSPP